MGLMQVKALTEDTAAALVAARGRRPFLSLADFWRRTELDRNAVENLIGVGAFDSLGVNRRTLLWQIEEVVRTISRHEQQAPLLHARTNSTARRQASGGRLPRPSQPATPAGIPPPELPPLTELDVAGLDFTLQDASARYSIMSFYRRSLQRARILSIGQLVGRAPGTLARVAGFVISRQRPPTAKGMTFLVLADEEGELPVAVYPTVYAQFREVINGSSSLVIEGSIERQRFVVSMLARRVWRLQEVAQLDEKPFLPHAQQRALSHEP
jgi:error-prone DNA polymerase